MTDRAYDLFKLFRVTDTDSNFKLWFTIESNRARGEHKVVAFQNFVMDDGASGREKRLGEVITAPNVLLARKAVSLAGQIVEGGIAEEDAERAWVELCAEIDRVPALSHAEASGRRHEACQQKMLDSFRDEPLVAFGRVSCARRDIEAFLIVREAQTIAIVVTLKSGARHVCWSDTAGKEKEAYSVRASFVRLANQQYIDAELAAQFSVQTPVAKAPVDPLVPSATRDAGDVAANNDNDDEDDVNMDAANDEDADDDDKMPPLEAADAGTPIKLGEFPPLEPPIGASGAAGGDDDGKETLLNVVPENCLLIGASGPIPTVDESRVPKAPASAAETLVL